MQAVLEQVRTVAPYKVSVLLQGERHSAQYVTRGNSEPGRPCPP